MKLSPPVALQQLRQVAPSLPTVVAAPAVVTAKLPRQTIHLPASESLWAGKPALPSGLLRSSFTSAASLGGNG